MAEQVEKPNMLYPAYINKCRTVARGRRIPLQVAVENPKPQEIADALRGFKIEAGIEKKPYCRELSKEAYSWRIRYTNKDSSKNNLNNKRQIMIACAKRINEVRAASGPQTNQGPEGSGKQKKKK